MRGAPRQESKRLGNREKVQLCAARIAEALDAGGIKADAVLKSIVDMRSEQGNIFQRTERVAERELDEFYVVLMDKFNGFFFGIRHDVLLFSRSGWRLRQIQRG